MAKTVDDKKIIYTMDRVSRSHGTKQVLKDISLAYYYGAKIGVIGSNGSGKSSLLRIMAGVLSLTLTRQLRKLCLRVCKKLLTCLQNLMR